MGVIEITGQSVKKMEKEKDKLIERAWKMLDKDYQLRGQKAIIDKCYDREWCKLMGFDYSKSGLYSDIKQILYKRNGGDTT